MHFILLHFKYVAFIYLFQMEDKTLLQQKDLTHFIAVVWTKPEISLRYAYIHKHSHVLLIDEDIFWEICAIRYFIIVQTS